jgi:hypothetical protein
MKIEKLMAALEETLGRGSEGLVNSKQRVIQSLAAALTQTEKELILIVQGIADRVRPEVRGQINQVNFNVNTLLFRFGVPVRSVC